MRKAQQDGFALTEVLVTLMLIGVMFAGIVGAVLALTRSTATASDAARVNVIATGAGEALKAVRYLECTTGGLEGRYQEEFDRYESELPPEKRLLPDDGSAVVTIVGVDPSPGCQAGVADAGTQLIDFEVTVGGVSRSEQILKRNPDFASDFYADFDATLASISGDPVALFDLDASGSAPIEDIILYRWECGDPAATVAESALPDGESCEYPADAGADTTYEIRLTITDSRGRTISTTRPVVVPRALVARVPPVAVWTATCPSSSCATNSGGNYLTGTADLLVQFDGSSSSSADGTIESYRWDFGDPESSTANTSTLERPTHTFVRDRTYTVTLTVIDDIGATHELSRTIRVSRVTPPPPIAAFTRTPSPAVAPQTISFDGRSSRPDPSNPGDTIQTYSWNFGDGSPVQPPSTNPLPTHLYSLPGTYNVSLTVTNSAGSSTVTDQLVIGTFSNPSNFRLTSSRGWIPFIHSGNFYFAWTNPPRSAGDTVRYELQVRWVFGCFAFGNQTRTITAGPSGSFQFYDWAESGARICYGSTYEWRVRMLRVSPTDGTFTTSWTEFQRFTV